MGIINVVLHELNIDIALLLQSADAFIIAIKCCCWPANIVSNSNGRPYSNSSELLKVYRYNGLQYRTLINCFLLPSRWKLLKGKSCLVSDLQELNPILKTANNLYYDVITTFDMQLSLGYLSKQLQLSRDIDWKLFRVVSLNLAVF